MKRQVILRALIGAPIGVLISTIISLCVSWGIGDGTLYPVTSEASALFGSELAAATFQCISCLLYGAAWGAMSVIWDLSNWSLTKQTSVHFLLASSVTFPVMYFNCWVPHTVLAVVIYYLIFIGIYVGIWAGTFFRTRAQIREMNQTLYTRK